MNLPANKIDDALSHLDVLVDDGKSFIQFSPLVIGIIVIIALGIAVLLNLRANRELLHTRTVAPLTLLGIALGLSVTMIFSANYQYNFRDAKDGVEDAYKATIAENFKVGTEDMDAAEFTPTKDDTGAFSEVKFGYTDKDAMAHYDLVFLFDEETNEPTLLNTGTVDAEAIESLKK